MNLATNSDQHDRPEISIIIIGYNDAENLPTAIRSAVGQSFTDIEVIVADDHSSDNTPELIAHFESKDPRVKSVRLASNSGGCGAPRNAGLEIARGSYVMFLDSDDELTPNACQIFIDEARETGAEIVSGRTVRVHVGKGGSTEPWYGHLYETNTRVSSIDENPGLLYDTVVTNKIYSRDLIDRTNIRFRDDIHYEDLVFSAQAFSTAHGISFIPHTVYLWNVYPVDTRRSITNQRNQEKNLRDRILAASIANEIYASCSEVTFSTAIQKTLEHHLRLYIDDLPYIAQELAKSFLQIITQFLETLPSKALEDLTLPERLIYASIAELDLCAVLQLLEAQKFQAISGHMRYSNSLTTWDRGKSNPHFSSSLGKVLSSIPRDSASTPGADSNYGIHKLQYAQVRGHQLQISGTSTDPLGILRGPNSALQLRYGHGSEETYSTQFVKGDTEDTYEWQVSIKAPQRTAARERTARRLEIGLSAQGGEPRFSGLFTDPKSIGSIQPLKDRSPIGWLIGDSWVLGFETNGQIIFTLSPSFRGRFLRAFVRLGRYLLISGSSR